MAQKSSFIEQNLEKGIFGVCGVIALYVVITQFFGTPHGIEIGRSWRSPDSVDEVLGQEAKRLKKRLSSDVWPDQKVNDYGSDFREQFGTQMQRIGQAFSLPFVQFWPSLAPKGTIDVETAGKLTPPSVERPAAPVVVAGRGTARLLVLSGTPDPDNPEGTPTQERLDDVFWVSVGAKFPLARQWKQFLQETLPEEDRLPLNLQEMIFLRVQLERQQKLDTGEWSKAVEIKHWEMYKGLADFVEDYTYLAEIPQLPQLAAGSSPDALTVQTVQRYRDYVQEEVTQRKIKRPPFFELVAGDWKPPYDVDPGSSRGSSPRSSPDRLKRPPGMMSPDMMGPSGPFVPGVGARDRGRISRRSRGRNVVPGPQPGAVLPSRRIKPTQPKVEDVAEEEVIWGHDTSVQPGQTYRYRLRVVLYNPLVGRVEVPEDRPELRTSLSMEGPWSDWSESVTIEPVVKYFFTGVTGFGDQMVANVRAFCWHLGAWQETSFSLSIGQHVGSRCRVTLTGPIASRIRSDRVDFSTQDMILDYHQQRRFFRGMQGPINPVTGAEEMSFIDQSSAVLVLRDGQGGLESRYDWQDRQLMREFRQSQLPDSVPQPRRRERVAPSQRRGRRPVAPRRGGGGPGGVFPMEGPPGMMLPDPKRGKRGRRPRG